MKKTTNDALSGRDVLQPIAHSLISPAMLSSLGYKRFAYICEVSRDKAWSLYPKAKQIPENCDLFSLHSADGAALFLTDSAAKAWGYAWEKDLDAGMVN